MPWQLTILFPPGTPIAILQHEFQEISACETRAVYRSSLFTLTLTCINCRVRPLEFKPSLQLQKLTLQPYAWDTASRTDATILTLAFIDVVKDQKIEGGSIAIDIDGAPVPFYEACGAKVWAQLAMTVHSSQPNYLRKSKSSSSGRINDRPLPEFRVATLPPPPSPATAATAADELLREIHADIMALDCLMGRFYLPPLV